MIDANGIALKCLYVAGEAAPRLLEDEVPGQDRAEAAASPRWWHQRRRTRKSTLPMKVDPLDGRLPRQPRTSCA